MPSFMPRTRRNPRSMVMTRIGGVDYPMHSNPQCKTCQSPHRLKIERAFVEGLSYKSMTEMLAGLDPGQMSHPNAMNLSSHFQSNHMPMGLATQRAIIEKRAEEIGRDIENGSENLADYVTANRMVVQRGWERLQRGEIEPEMGDLLGAIKSLHAIEQSIGGSVDTEVWVQATSAFAEIVRTQVTPEQWNAIGAAMARNPVIAQLSEKLTAQEEAAVAQLD